MKAYNYPPGYSFFATYQRAIRLVRHPIQGITESLERFGDSYTAYSGVSNRMILTQDPEFIEYVLKKNHKNYYKSEIVSKKLGRFIGNGLLTSNGPYWLRQRRLIQPGFHIQKVQRLYEIMKKTIDDFLMTFPENKEVDIYPQMNRLAFEIVIKTLFDIKVPPESASELLVFIRETQEFLIREIYEPYKSWWFVLSGEKHRTMKKAIRARDILRGLVRERKACGKKFNDLLDMLIDSRYEDTGEPMSEEQILDEILILFIAGHETTGNALTWTLYLLAQHPQELEKVRASTRDLGIMESVAHELLAALINESMRLYPPAWASDRVALEADSFKAFTFPKDTIILLYYYGLHRNELYWKDATAFLPERFLHIDKEKTKAFYPFGGGPRLCIGNNFALAEMALFIQAFIQKFDVQPTNVIPTMRPMITLRPERVILQIKRKEG